ncbi:MAG TPA: 6-bladed beta-propeller [Candidatus Parabacteroides intestinipullorum]|uniref:6-bladed beta-propeller n=1 Tax=Candidatus Parabacteroides intestinipullorum TaxID=2838723 RepID=A0A9D1X9A4_9BACT|nr:6-bladed beta-propeller [Candidatus Parabacteroides intestinipullorum]
MINKLKKHVRWMSALLVASLLFGCGNGKQKESDGLIRVDVSKSYPKKELILQDLFDIEYVPLETTDEFITTGNVRAVGEKIIVTKNNGRLDGDIFLFDRTTGKGILHFDHLGQGGEDYTNILEILLDEKQGEIFVNNHYSRKVVVYDLEGNFKRSWKHNSDTFYDQIGCFDEDYLICHDSGWEKSANESPEKRDYFMFISKQDGKTTSIPLLYDRKISQLVWSSEGKAMNYPRNKELFPYLGDWLLMETSSDTIFRIGKGLDLKPFIVRTPSVQEGREFLLYPGIYSNRYQFMQKVKMEYDFQTREGFPRTDIAYDKIENKVYEAVVYNGDFLEKMPMKLGVNIFILNIFNNEGVSFTETLYAPDLVEALNDGKLRGPLKEIASRLDEEDNPVILIAKYKK